MILDSIKKFIFPSRCAICDAVLPFGNKLENEFLCNECRSKIEFIKEPTCKKCGAMIYDSDEAYCTRCQAKKFDSFEYGFGLCRYNDAVKESLHKIKYSGRKEYIAFYGKLIAKAYHDKFMRIGAEYLVPVPVHRQRNRERGYNQASVLAYVISDELKKYNIDIPVNENLIFRTKNTKVLNKLDPSERGKELSGAFKTTDCTGIEKVIIVDDIATSLSTLDSISKILKSAGVMKVYYTVIAVVDNL